MHFTFCNRIRVMCIAAMVCATVFSGGCASYSVGRAADFRAMGITPEVIEQQTDVSIARRLERKALAAFPSSIAVVRVQEPEYCSRTARGYGRGKFSIVTTRDVESDDAFATLSSLPMVRGVAPLNRLVIPERLDSEEHLRQGAAAVQADMLLIYTFDTVFVSDRHAAPLGFFTLGLFPDRTARVTSTASAAIVDTRNGYVYGLAESTGKQSQLTNAWNNEQAVDDSRRKAEEEAFTGLVKEIEECWRGVVREHAAHAAAQSS